MKKQAIFKLIEDAGNNIRNEVIAEALNQSTEYHKIAEQLEIVQEQIYHMGLSETQLSVIQKYTALAEELSEKESCINYTQGVKIGIYFAELRDRKIE